MGYKTIYHGSEIIIKKPVFHYQNSNFNNDYGSGFYCTQDLGMAKQWANRTTKNGFANKYFFDERGLKILDLTNKNEFNVLNWIAILLRNREIPENDKIEYADVLTYLKKYYIDTSSYDVVIGYRADDAYFRFPLMFVRNILTFSKLEEIYMLGNLDKQYVLLSEKAFENLMFVEAIPADPIYFERYHRQKDAADDSYYELERLERKSNEPRIRDLMRIDND